MAKKKRTPTPDWKKRKPPIRLKTFGAERKELRGFQSGTTKLKRESAKLRKESRGLSSQIFGGTNVRTLSIYGEKVGTATDTTANMPTKERVAALQRGLEIDKERGKIGERVKLREEQLRKAKGELRWKQLKEVQRVAGEAAERVSSVVGKALNKRVISRRVLKRNRATVVVKEHEPAPYIPIFFKR